MPLSAYPELLSCKFPPPCSINSWHAVFICVACGAIQLLMVWCVSAVPLHWHLVLLCRLVFHCNLRFPNFCLRHYMHNDFLYTVWVTKFYTPKVFRKNFSMAKIFNQNFTCLLHIHVYIKPPKFIHIMCDCSAMSLPWCEWSPWNLP